MAQTYQPGVTPHQSRHEGEEPKSSGFYQKGGPVEGGWGFVLPREDGRIEIVPARNGAVIGSDEGADVRIVGNDIAARHARVEVRADGVYLEDLESPHGTFVGGVRARRIGVAHGDVVRFGNQLGLRGTGARRLRRKDRPCYAARSRPRDIAAFVEPALNHARAGRRLPSKAGRASANERWPNLRRTSVNRADRWSPSTARVRPGTAWLPPEPSSRPLGFCCTPSFFRVRYKSRSARSEPDPGSRRHQHPRGTPRSRDGRWSHRAGFGALFNGRRVSVPPLSARREAIPGIVWALAKKLDIDEARLSVELSNASRARLARRDRGGDRRCAARRRRTNEGTLDASSIQRPLTRPPSAYPSLPRRRPALARERSSTPSPRRTARSFCRRARSGCRGRRIREAQRLGWN